MESLEKFIEKRMQQSEFSAMMIPRYLERPDAFVGSKNYTLEQAEEAKKDAKKCKAVIEFLKKYNKQQRLLDKSASKIKCHCKNYEMSHDCYANCEFVPFENKT